MTTEAPTLQKSLEDTLASQVTRELPGWDAEIDDVLVCRQVRDETHDVKTFVFSAREPRLFRYKPGQFITLDLPIGGQVINRCYTISSAPTRGHLISITVKRVPGGTVSNWLHDTLKPGMELRAVGPLGDFTAFDHPAPKFLFLSGGSGVTPLMSMARTYHDLAQDRDIVFVHSARSPADIIFRTELDLMARNLPRFSVAHVCETTEGERTWSGFRGRLTLPMLRLIAPDLMDRTILTCGPSPYMAAVRAMLREAGFDMGRYHEESFNFEELAEAQPDAAAASAIVPVPPPAQIPPVQTAMPATRTFRVEFAKTGRVIECAADTNILTAARTAGMRLPSSCTKGLCGTCKSKLVSGAVDMKHAGGIRQREIDAGQVLLCCSKPTSDVVVDR
ncbi:ferredoxin oxidoreductase [Skermanella stibiiresistens SB22]|uniref:Ferredoxin oxidoreductase n=2 Tax=Skermanella TaxID=204447 RepID=W9H8V3_9PROT|nr:ferredoxin oxidoreductase [Skermanella stibiiresistens SB22]